MAATRLIKGVQREIWQELAPQAPGGQLVPTGIRISSQKLPCVQGFLTIDAPTGTPTFTAQPLVVSGHLVVLVTNTAPGGNSGTWTLDIRLVQSSDQANTNGGTGVILVAQNGAGGIAVPETLTQAYSLGASAAAQTLPLADANGGGLLVDGAGGGFTTGPALEVRQNALHDTVALVSRYINQFVGPELQLYHSRGTVLAPVDLQDSDELGTLNFNGRVGGASVLGARVVGVAISAAGLDAGIDIYGTTASVPTQIARFDVRGPGSTPEIILYGDGYVVPSSGHQGHLGISGNVWSTSDTDTIRAYKTILLDCTDAIVTGDGSSLEVRQSVAHGTPAVFSRRGNDAVGPILEFDKARGTYGAPADVAINDVLGEIDFIGRLTAPIVGSRIIATCIGDAPFFTTNIAFYTAPRSTGVATRTWSMDFNSVGATAELIGFGTYPMIIPETVSTGSLGANGQQWDLLFVDTARVYQNVCLGGATPGVGALHTVVLPSATTARPAASVGLAHVYAYALDAVDIISPDTPALSPPVTGTALAWSQGAPVADGAGKAALIDRIVPVVINGTIYYLTAIFNINPT